MQNSDYSCIVVCLLFVYLFIYIYLILYGLKFLSHFCFFSKHRFFQGFFKEERKKLIIINLNSQIHICNPAKCGGLAPPGQMCKKIFPSPIFTNYTCAYFWPPVFQSICMFECKFSQNIESFYFFFSNKEYDASFLFKNFCCNISFIRHLYFSFLW